MHSIRIYNLSGPQTSKRTHVRVQCNQCGANNRIGMLLRVVCTTPRMFTKLMEFEGQTFPEQTLTD